MSIDKFSKPREYAKDIEKEILDSLRKAFENQLDLDTKSAFVPEFARIFAVWLFEVQKRIEYNISILDKDKAPGRNLDILAKLQSSSGRKPATATELEQIKITAEVPGVLPLGFVITDKNNNRYKSEEIIDIVDDGSGIPSAFGNFQNEKTGDLDLPDKKTFSFNSEIKGLSIVFDSDVSLIKRGRDIESDPAFRSRMDSSAASNARTVVDSTIANVLANEAVSKVAVYEYNLSYRFKASTEHPTPDKAWCWQLGGSEPEPPKGQLGYAEVVVKFIEISPKDNEIKSVAQSIYDGPVMPGIYYGNGADGDPNKYERSLSSEVTNIMGDDVNVVYSLAKPFNIDVSILVRKHDKGVIKTIDEMKSRVKEVIVSFLDEVEIAGLLDYSYIYQDLISDALRPGFSLSDFTWKVNDQDFHRNLIDFSSVDIRGARAYPILGAIKIDVE